MRQGRHTMGFTEEIPSRAFLTLGLILFLILAAVFAGADLGISIALYDPASSFAKFIDAFGEVPGLLWTLGAAVVLHTNRRRRGPLGEVGMNVLMFCLFAAPILYLLAIPERAKGPLTLAGTLLPPSWPVLVLAFFAMHAATRMRGLRFSAESERTARITIWLLLIHAVVFVHGCKFFWGRIRFRDLAPDYADFTPFYLPQGMTGHTSFVSGHTALGWMILPALLVTARLPRSIRLAILLVVVAWGSSVAVGRIILGAHYASDVLFPTGFAVMGLVGLRRRTETELNRQIRPVAGQ